MALTNHNGNGRSCNTRFITSVDVSRCTLARPATPQADDVQTSGSWKRWALKGLCVSGLNPKVFLLFLALLPQFTDTTAVWPVPMQMIALGLIHTVSCGVIYLLVGFGSQVVLQARPAAARFVSRFSGSAMIVIAVVLFTEQVWC
jgi:threonine/homoserine/homoserine lactone efflux protein